MALPLTAGMPLEVRLSSGYVVRFEALDATGAAVGGVTVSNVSIFGDQLAGPIDDTTPWPLLVPSDQFV